MLPKDHEIDDAMIDLVAQRLWLWVVSERHEDMSPTDEMRGHVWKALIGGDS